MHLELVELLRCPRPHAPGVLVAASDRTSARYVLEGLLGCPECGAEYVIRGGVAYFADAISQTTRAASDTEYSEQALRAAAQLGMTEGRSVFALVGFPARTVLAVRALVPARLLIVDPFELEAFGDPSVTLGDAPAGIVRTAGLMPLALGKFDGVAFAALPEPPLLDQAVALLKSAGRLVAPATCAVPRGMTELVRDDRDWVATRDAAASAPVGITRR